MTLELKPLIGVCIISIVKYQLIIVCSVTEPPLPFTCTENYDIPDLDEPLFDANILNETITIEESFNGSESS